MGIPRWQTLRSKAWARAFAIVAVLVGGLYVVGGYLAILTARSLKRSPPPAALGVVSPETLRGIGIAHAALGLVAVGAGAGMAVGKLWAVRGWQLTCTAMAAESLFQAFLHQDAFGLSDVVVPAVLVCMSVGSWILLRKGHDAVHPATN